MEKIKERPPANSPGNGEGHKPGKGEAKSDLMRTRLMEATLDVIIEEGWAGASTPKICQHARVSRGAQTHHFPTKNALFMAAIDKLARDYERSMEERVQALPSEKRSLRALLQVIWDSCLDDRFLQTTIEAMVAARTDADLRETIANLDKEAIDYVRRLARTLTTTDIATERLEDAVEISLYFFRGLVVQRGMHGDDKYRGRLFDVWCSMVERALEVQK